MTEVTTQKMHPTASFAIVTDTACDLSEEWLAQKNVALAPMYIHMGGKTMRDYIDIAAPDFYLAAAQARKQATTSAPSAEEYKKIFQDLLDQGYANIVSVHLSSKVSASHGMACVAIRELDAAEKIVALDSKTMSAAEGFIVEDLVASRENNVSFAAALVHAHKIIKATRLFVVPARGTVLGNNGHRACGVRGKTRTLLSNFSRNRTLFEIDEEGRFFRIASSEVLVRLAGDIVREMSLYSQKVGPLAYAEISSGMPRDLEITEKPMDTNEFEKRRIRISNVSAATAVHLGVSAVGVAFLPDGLIGMAHEDAAQRREAEVVSRTAEKVAAADKSADKKINILLLGSGGREHALLTKLQASPRAGKCYVCPGNGGMWTIAHKADFDAANPQAVVEFARTHDIDLVVIGPEAPLVQGVADVVHEAGIAVFGPTRAAAQMEGSKRFAKEIMQRAGVPTAAYQAFTDEAACQEYVATQPTPLVVKADGLAAGKGVIIAQTADEAYAAVHECFTAFGNAGQTVVVEEFLKGPECSLLTLTDGKTVIPLATAQDHKRALEGDTGPNTGGMGVYSPVPFVTDDEMQQMISIQKRVVAQLASEGITYKGCLYGGFMLTKDGPKVLEFNARFGDPETQVILPRMQADLLDIFMHIDADTLDEVSVAWDDRWAVSVVLTAAGYPGAYKKGDVISGIEQASALPDVLIYQAGTSLNEKDELVTAGGRVINVTALGDSFEQAREKAYAACELIHFVGKTYRCDIGLRALRGRRAWEV